MRTCGKDYGFAGAVWGLRRGEDAGIIHFDKCDCDFSGEDFSGHSQNDLMRSFDGC
jgi:hypothetical protein